MKTTAFLPLILAIGAAGCSGSEPAGNDPAIGTNLTEFDDGVVDESAPGNDAAFGNDLTFGNGIAPADGLPQLNGSDPSLADPVGNAAAL